MNTMEDFLFKLLFHVLNKVKDETLSDDKTHPYYLPYPNSVVDKYWGALVLLFLK